MILIHGEVLSNDKQDEIIKNLKQSLLITLENSKPLDIQKVINACDTLYKRVMDHKYDDIALPLLKSLNIPYSMLMRYAYPFSRNGLEKKVKIELRNLFIDENVLDEHNTYKRVPLGILFHISAGNVDLLPAYSVIEGLLSGNINILKLPSGDNGLSIKLLKELIEIEPTLKDYIYVFDVPSTEIESIKTLSSYANATIVWGGDDVSKAARQFVDIHSKLIIWGHKISFSYVDNEVEDEELEKLAQSICFSNQILCSSAQGIYLNTEKEEDLKILANRFIKILSKVSREDGGAPLTMRARNSLLLYNEKIEGRQANILQENGVSIRIDLDPKLELSFLYRNIWIKPLPKNKIISILQENKGLLQTVSISVNKEDQKEVYDKFIKAGVTRIVRLGNNSRMIAGESHDGEYPLQRYTKIVEIAN